LDLTCRNDLRTINDTNFARFEAVLEARFAQAEVRPEPPPRPVAPHHPSVTRPQGSSA
jgi:hypothetical protein